MLASYQKNKKEKEKVFAFYSAVSFLCRFSPSASKSKMTHNDPSIYQSINQHRKNPTIALRAFTVSPTQ